PAGLAPARFYLFHAEDGIRDFHVTGVQTCALPISATATTSMTVWTSSRSRCAHDRRRGLPRPGSRAVHPGSAHASALAGPPRTVAGRRGVVVPVVVGDLSAGVAGVAHP